MTWRAVHTWTMSASKKDPAVTASARTPPRTISGDAAQGGRGRGRPRKAVLDLDMIVNAALEVLSESGLAEFSLGRIAAKLGVKTPALYNHVDSRAELIAQMRNRTSSNIDTAPFLELPWDEALVPWAWSYRAAFTIEPHLTALLAVAPLGPADRSVINNERMIDSLDRGGWPLDEQISVMVACESFIIGSALDSLAGPDNLALPHHPTATNPAEETAQRHFPATPKYLAALQARDARGTVENTLPADTAFELGLEVFIDGLRARLQRLRA